MRNRQVWRIGDSAPQVAVGLLLLCGSVRPISAQAADIGALTTSVQQIIEIGKEGCASDIETYCATVTPGEGRLAFCLIANADKRSDRCESALIHARAAAEELINDVQKSAQACGPDISSHCAGTVAGEGRIAQCLADNRPSLSPACGEVVDVVGRVIFASRNEPAAAPPPEASPVPPAAGSLRHQVRRQFPLRHPRLQSSASWGGKF